MESEPSASAARRLRGYVEREGGEKNETAVIEEEWWKDPISEEVDRS